jgi:hypothetical protein
VKEYIKDLIDRYAKHAKFITEEKKIGYIADGAVIRCGKLKAGGYKPIYHTIEQFPDIIGTPRGGSLSRMLTVYFYLIDSFAEANHDLWAEHISLQERDLPSTKSKGLGPGKINFITDNFLFHGKNIPIESSAVEFGCYTGVSSAKFSILTSLIGKDLYIFDSFLGLPDPENYGSKEQARVFSKGDYAATIETVMNNINEYASLSGTVFVPGYFCDSIPTIENEIGPIGIAFVDVDLEKSIDECLSFIVPRLQKGSLLFCDEFSHTDNFKIFEKHGLTNLDNFEISSTDGNAKSYKNPLSENSLKGSYGLFRKL